MIALFNFHHVEPQAHPSHKDSLTITPEGLRRMVKTLRRLGWEIVPIQSFLEAPLNSKGKERKQVVLTFDDGFENFYQYAWPILEAEQCPATVFVLAGMFSGTNDWDQAGWPEAERDSLLSLKQMEEMAGSPWVSFGSHGFKHLDMKGLSVPELETMVFQSYETLSRVLKERFFPVFAYPHGRYSEKVLSVMELSSYRYGFTTETGLWTEKTPRFTVPRYGVNRQDGSALRLMLKLLKHGLLL